MPANKKKRDTNTLKLHAKIISIDWTEAQQDVARFLKPREAESLKLWDKDFFIHYLDQLKTLSP